MDQDVLMFVVMVGGVVLVTGHVVRWLRLRTLHETLREALRRGEPAPEALLARLDDTAGAGAGDGRNGLILIALGLALIGYGALADGGANLRQLAGVALFPILVGAALGLKAVMAGRRRPPGS